MKKYLGKLFVPKSTVHAVDKQQVLLVLPLLGPLSFEIRSRLQKCFRNSAHLLFIKGSILVHK